MRTNFFELVRSAWPYRNLTRDEFDEVVTMLAEGFSTKRGRRAALIHHDAINHRLRGRRGARLLRSHPAARFLTTPIIE